MNIPEPRGPIKRRVSSLVTGDPGADPSALASLHALVTERVAVVEDLIDDDVQLALFCLYELHYGGLAGVDDRWEWHSGLIGIRQLLEEPFEAWLRSETSMMTGSVRRPDSRTRGATPPQPSCLTWRPVTAGPVSAATWRRRRLSNSSVNS